MEVSFLYHSFQGIRVELQAIVEGLCCKMIATKAKLKKKPQGPLQKKMKETLDSFADKRKKKTIRTLAVEGDLVLTTSGQNGTTPLLHREGLSCAVEVPSTRGSC